MEFRLQFTQDEVKTSLMAQMVKSKDLAADAQLKMSQLGSKREDYDTRQRLEYMVKNHDRRAKMFEVATEHLPVGPINLTLVECQTLGLFGGIEDEDQF